MTANAAVCFVFFFCLGYLTKKMYEQTNESLYWKQSRIRGNDSGTCARTETVGKEY